MLKGNERADLIDFLQRYFGEHRECEDGWYSCPKSESYLRDDDRPCDCGKVVADALVARLYLREPKLTPHIKRHAEELGW